MALAADPGQPRPAVRRRAARCSRSTSSPTTPGQRRRRRPATIQSQLATDWKVDGTTVTLRSADGITCADGCDFTATTVADNIAYVGDPKNKSPFLGIFLPVGATAKADDAAGTVTLTLAAPAPFVLNGLASLPMVCDAGMKDRAVARRHDRPAPAPTSSPRPRPATTTPTRSATATPGARTARPPPSRACPTRS